MQLEDLLAQTGGLAAMARELGVSEQQAQTGAAALLPAILGGFGKRAPASGGGGLVDLLGQLGGGSLLDDVLAPQPTPVERGNDVLGQIFGSKDVSRAVASHASSRTGIDPSLLKRMLPMVAMLVTGYLSRRARAAGSAPASGGGLGDLLGSVLGGAAGSPGRGGLGGLGGLGAMLDADGNGNPLDDILRQAGRTRLG
jgi:hypothetical protein